MVVTSKMTGLGASIMTYASKMTGFKIGLFWFFPFFKRAVFFRVNTSVWFDKLRVYLCFGCVKVNKAFVILSVLTHRLCFIMGIGMKLAQYLIYVLDIFCKY